MPHSQKVLPVSLSRNDSIYDSFAARVQANSTLARAFYLFMHLAPGLFAVCVLNVNSIYEPLRDLSGLGDRTFQYALFILVTFGWHIALPCIVLMKVDGLKFNEMMACLGLNRFDARGAFVILPLVLIPFTLVCVPYQLWFADPFQAWLETIPAFQIPEHSIFAGALYDFPPIMLLFLLIGNFVGEEIYYRGYLMKKCAFLGKHTWWMTSMLFAVYHFWQIPQTWPWVLPVLIFGYIMILRKDIYVAIILHAFLNLAWFSIVEFLSEHIV